MSSRGDHDRLVARLYSAAAGEAPWAAALQDVASRFNGGAAVFQVHDASGKIVSSVTQACSSVAHPSAGGAKSQPEHLLGASLRLPGGMKAGLALLAAPGEARASASARRCFHRLAVHLERACVLGHAKECDALTRAVLLDALAHKADGILLLDFQGMVVFMNDGAGIVMSADDGLRLARGSFITRRGPETRKLRGLVGNAVAASILMGERLGGHMLITRPSGRRPYVLRVMPAPQVERFLAHRAVACVIFIQDLARTNLPSRESLLAVFGLTEREADLAIELVRCTGLRHAAVAAGMAVNTARNHLQSIFRKTATASQADVVRLLGRLF
jgi:DNA-binding NarL/FixJ family response regulator